MKKEDLIDIISNIKTTSFLDDELAYLAVTKKVEDPLRDAVSFQIHKKLLLLESSSIVCREYQIGKRISIDTSIIDQNNNPEILIEFKAHSSINFPTFMSPKSKDNEMGKDILKITDYAKRSEKWDPELYFIFFNNIIKSPRIPLNLKPSKYNISENNPVKYFSLINNSTIHLPYATKVQEVIKNWTNLLNMLKLPIKYSSFVEIDAGKYCLTEVSVIAFIYGPFKKGSVKVKPGSTYENLELVGFEE